MALALAQQKLYTINDIYSLPEGERAELVDGQIYYMAPPTRRHQRITGEIFALIREYANSHSGSCEVDISPFAVFLNKDDVNYVEPDISVICDKNKLDEYGCNGAPDWIIEIVSPSTERMDYGIKLFKYRSAGVREYWIINPVNRTVNIYDFQSNEKTGQYSFDNDIRSCIYDDLSIKIADLLL